MDLTPAGRSAAPTSVAVTGHPRSTPGPTRPGKRLAYVHAGRAAGHQPRVTRAEDQVLADPRGAAGVTFGLAEFIAAEEMGRARGYWWSPDGSALLVARVDETPVRRWHIADPANPERPPAVVAYPAAGTPNAAVSLRPGPARRHAPRTSTPAAPRSPTWSPLPGRTGTTR